MNGWPTMLSSWLKATNVRTAIEKADPIFVVEIFPVFQNDSPFIVKSAADKNVSKAAKKERENLIRMR